MFWKSLIFLVAIITRRLGYFSLIRVQNYNHSFHPIPELFSDFLIFLSEILLRAYTINFSGYSGLTGFAAAYAVTILDLISGAAGSKCST